MIRQVFISVIIINYVGIIFTVGSFWQISDLHIDRNYSVHGDSKSMCHGNVSNVTLSKFGNYNCDAPLKLIIEAIVAMKQLYQTPDFILWTGDIMAHLPDNQITWDEVYSALNLSTNQILDTFPNTILFPVVGNHDVHPANVFPDVGFSKVYERYLTDAGWGKLVPHDQVEFFKKGGYYSKDVNEKLKVIVLNTNIYLTFNKNRSRAHDPASQLSWLENQLQLAKKNLIKVIITAHAPPGFFERNPLEPFLASPYNEKYIALLVKYSDVILTQIYGHTHTDTFRLFNDKSGAAKTHGFISPSVSPFHISGTKGINPSIRLYNYDLHEAVVTDYHQYFLNLSDVTQKEDTFKNEIKTTQQDVTQSKSVSWELLYRATELYGVQNLDVKSLYKMYKTLSTNEDIFNKYYLYNSAGVEDKPCDEKCRIIHLCAITKLTSEEMENCLKLSPSMMPANDTDCDDCYPPHHHHPHGRKITPRIKYIIIGIALGLFVALVIMAVVASAFCVRRRFKSGFRYQKHVSYNTT